MNPELAADLAGTSLAMARRFHAGATMWCAAPGWEPHAHHIAVEFVHPVIVGKRALPAICLTADVATITGIAEREGVGEVFAHQIRALARPDDIALGIGDSAGVRGGLAAARELGLLTVALTGPDSDGNGAGTADHTLTAASGDPRVVKEIHVTMYHVLWELVHVFFEQPGVLA